MDSVGIRIRKNDEKFDFHSASSLVKRSDDEPGVVCFRPPLEAEECYASHYLYNVSYNVNSVSPAPVCANQLCF